MKSNAVYLKGYLGFGDNIWQRPFIKKIASGYEVVYLETYFPFLFTDIPNVRFVQPTRGRKLLTCAKMKDKYGDMWVNKPDNTLQIHFAHYLQTMRDNETVQDAWGSRLNISGPMINDLPIKDEWIIDAYTAIAPTVLGDESRKKLCIIRPPSDRKDWTCSARTPAFEPFQALINHIRNEYVIVSIADRINDQVIGELQGIDVKFENGELSLETIIGLVSLSDLVVAQNCFLFPMGLALNVPTVCVNGGFSHPSLYADPRYIDISKLHILTPEPTCHCLDRSHKCDKIISMDKVEQLASILCPETYKTGVDFNETSISRIDEPLEVTTAQNKDFAVINVYQSLTEIVSIKSILQEVIPEEINIMSNNESESMCEYDYRNNMIPYVTAVEIDVPKVLIPQVDSAMAFRDTLTILQSVKVPILLLGQTAVEFINKMPFTLPLIIGGKNPKGLGLKLKQLRCELHHTIVKHYSGKISTHRYDNMTIYTPRKL